MSTWKDNRVGVLSVTADDSSPWGFDDLVTNGVAGTYVMWLTTAPTFYTTYYAAGMELGSHTSIIPLFSSTNPRFVMNSKPISSVWSTPLRNRNPR